MPKPTKKAPAPKRAEPVTPGGPAERLTITLFEADTAIIKRLRNGLFADIEEIATSSEIIRFLLRTAPKTLDAQGFLAHRAEMKAEDGRAKRFADAAAK